MQTLEVQRSCTLVVAPLLTRPDSPPEILQFLDGLGFRVVTYQVIVLLPQAYQFHRLGQLLVGQPGVVYLLLQPDMVVMLPHLDDRGRVLRVPEVQAIAHQRDAGGNLFDHTPVLEDRAVKRREFAQPPHLPQVRVGLAVGFQHALGGIRAEGVVLVVRPHHREIIADNQLPEFVLYVEKPLLDPHLVAGDIRDRVE